MILERCVCVLLQILERCEVYVLSLRDAILER
jgi:hypothetical protein